MDTAPLLSYGGLGAFGIAVTNRFAMNSLAMAAGLIIMTIALHFWSRNRYQMSLQTSGQSLLESLQQKHEGTIKALQDAHNETVLQACANQVEAERKHIETLMTDLAQRFDTLSNRLGGQNQEKTETGEIGRLS